MKRFLVQHAKRQFTTLKNTEAKTLSQVTRKERILEKKQEKQQELLKTFNALIEQKKSNTNFSNSRSFKSNHEGETFTL